MLPVVEMAYPTNVMIQGGTLHSAQGDLHIYNRDSESGMSAQFQVRSDEHPYR